MNIRMLFGCLAVPLVCASAFGADAEAGRHLAQLRRAACHIVAPGTGRRELADAPPFELIGRKYEFDVDMIAMNLMGRTPK